MKVFDSPNAKIEYDESKKRLTQTWDGFASSEVFRLAIDATVSFVKTKPVKTILSDTLNQKVVKPDDTEYASKVMPQLFGSGVKAMAFVMPQNVLTQMSLKGFAKNMGNDGLNFFSTISEASKWLDGV